MNERPTSYYLVYTSLAKTLMSSAALLELLEQSQTENEQLAITGMLIYMETRFLDRFEGRFIQLIEGEKTAIIQLYEKINRDPRHQQLLLLASGEQKARNFPGWSMSFISEPIEKHGYREPDMALFEVAPFTVDGPACFLKEFYQYNLHLRHEELQRFENANKHEHLLFTLENQASSSETN